MRDQPGSRVRLLWMAGVIALGTAGLAGCLPDVSSTAPQAPATSAPSVGAQPWTPNPTQSAAARVALTHLQVREPQRSNADYRRAAFGSAWTDTDQNGCNQRDDVLLRDVVTSAPFRVGTQRGCDHDVLAGTWIDPYSGKTVTLTDAKSPEQAPLVQIDHIVALSVAWRDGARDWSDDQRLRFANDLRNLVATSGATNQTKSGSDAASWQPLPAAQCGYAVRYIGVKDAYALTVRPAEKAALAGMLDRCT